MNEVITNNPKKRDEALAALHQVIDPEIGLNIVDLGLLYQIDFDEGNKIVFISMTLTTQFCPMGDSIRSNAGQAMQQAFPDYTIDIDLVFDPPWSPERISEQGQEFLNR
ncbi:metal-sulfur cluster assembly factor [Flavisolibacter ginsenosidimutans]|uniref:Metal-sulfur cluster assembly factor n=1 Tax=Flavisolibacter ginsenosidimutans TaxID=661481 RepID=A0A5B8UDE3_9BACT|nr:metal-sulfur cluster assembly factor [Flavisolibacter ginsenosidimutans]QEC54584.1 metal-sulfur cluster assembly factor [Flavisolibacter ginsenosidimutans]